MYHMLVIDNDPSTKDFLRQSLPPLNRKVFILSAKDADEAHLLTVKYNIDFFIINITSDYNATFCMVEQIRQNEKYIYTPIVFVCTSIDYILIAYHKMGCMDYISKPLTKESFGKTGFLVKTFADAPRNTASTKKEYLVIDSLHSFHKIYIDEILFVESYERNCIVHTYDEEICVHFTMKQFISMIDNTTLMQSHRSFIINTVNVRFVEKSLEPWIVFFRNNPQTALVSRSFKKAVMAELPIEQKK